MKFIGFEREDEALAWARQRAGDAQSQGLCRAISVVDDYNRLSAVVVFSGFTPRNIDMHVALSGHLPARVARELFNHAFGYAFGFESVARVTGLIRADNIDGTRFCAGLGFGYEGCLRDALPDMDVVIYSMLRSEYMAHPWRIKEQ